MRWGVCELPLISVIVCAHNEEAYVDKCLPFLINALKDFSNEIIFIADRCTDNTAERARKYNVKIIEKKWRNWESSYAESLQVGYTNARGAYLGIVDVDIMVPANFFKDIVPMIRGDVASIAASVVTYPDTLWNRIMYAWEKTYGFAPLGREPYGAAMVICKKALDEIGGFRSVPTPDTDINIRLVKRGYKSIATSVVKVYHMRHISLGTMIDGQINCGRGRYALGISLVRTMGHALFRLRPLIIYGWFSEWQKTSTQKRGGHHGTLYRGEKQDGQSIYSHH